MFQGTPKNIRNAIKAVIPNWLSDRPELNVAFSVIFTIALVCDLFVEQLMQGIFAALPGAGTPTALPYIGRSRGVLRGLNETDAAYIIRLLNWLDMWEVAGGAETLVTLVQRVIGPANYVVRLIDRSGNFVTANADGTTTFTRDTSWDWDSHIADYSTSRASFWGDMWIVIYVNDGAYPIYSSFSDPAWIGAWGSTQGFGLGHQVTREVVDIIYQAIAGFKGAHTWMSAIVFTNDTSLFVPGSLGSTYPGGTCGNWSWYHSGAQVPGRLTIGTSGGKYIRYWIPPYGG